MRHGLWLTTGFFAILGVTLAAGQAPAEEAVKDNVLLAPWAGQRQRVMRLVELVSGVHTSEQQAVAQLPRVVIEGRRDPSADGAQVASACVAPAVC